MKLPSFSRKRTIWSIIFLTFLVWYIFSLPSPLFDARYSTVLYDSAGNLLSASIAEDGQWRFPEASETPSKFADALLVFEDKRFYTHPGIDPAAIYRAAVQNIKSRKVVSGGSTITMQVIRMARGNRSRNVFNKFIEMVLATRLEWSFSKEEILALYAAHAPFGGNVVGIEAACWRYFGRQPDELSWAEAATLAVLPNNPSMIHPGSNRTALLAKRDRLLHRLHAAGKFDDVTLELALAESIPDDPLPLPRLAPHLLTFATQKSMGETKVKTTLNSAVQERVNEIIANHHHNLKGNKIYNAAALVLDVHSGNVIAYVGNTEAGYDHQSSVDVVQARRSSGSILKPFLYAAMLNEGLMLPRSLQSDIPTIINGFSPRNFSKQYDGAVSADQALIRSLNIPAVQELRTFRYEKFHRLLNDIGFTTINKPADHYGLSLILGGAETSLWEVTGAYASMARVLNQYFTRPGSMRYDAKDWHAPSFVVDSTESSVMEAHGVLDAASIWTTFEVLKEVYRPGEETGWKNFFSSRRIAWKTGTSFGFRDGWAVGVTPDYAVGVWVGNADGEGRPGLTGTETAAPILFDIFSFLPGQGWFSPPESELAEMVICPQSGARVSEWCTEGDTVKLPRAGLKTAACTYHKQIFLSADKKYRVHSGCADLQEMVSAKWFILPPAQEYYYKVHHASYRAVPPFRKDCADPQGIAAMDVIYPRDDSRIFVSTELDGKPGNTVFQVAHRNSGATIFWHLDGEYMGSTKGTHKLTIAPGEGLHNLTLVDNFGHVYERHFRVISKR